MSRAATASAFRRGVRVLRGAVFGVSAFLVTSCLTAPPTRPTDNEAKERARTTNVRPPTVVLLAIHVETARPHFVFVALGEPDEYAHRGDYRGYLRALRHADLAIGGLSRALRENARDGARTVLLVTTDHGRARDFKNHGAEHPESARVFLFAWGSEVRRARLAPSGARHLADIAPTLRVLFGLAPDRNPSAGRPFAGLFGGRAG